MPIISANSGSGEPLNRRRLSSRARHRHEALRDSIAGPSVGKTTRAGAVRPRQRASERRARTHTGKTVAKRDAPEPFDARIDAVASRAGLAPPTVRARSRRRLREPAPGARRRPAPRTAARVAGENAPRESQRRAGRPRRETAPGRGAPTGGSRPACTVDRAPYPHLRQVSYAADSNTAGRRRSNGAGRASGGHGNRTDRPGEAGGRSILCTSRNKLCRGLAAYPVG